MWPFNSPGKATTPAEYIAANGRAYVNTINIGPAVSWFLNPDDSRTSLAILGINNTCVLFPDSQSVTNMQGITITGTDIPLVIDWFSYRQIVALGWTFTSVAACQLTYAETFERAPGISQFGANVIRPGNNIITRRRR